MDGYHPLSRQASRTHSSNFASLGTSPGSSSLVAHSLPQHLQRDDLQAMQDAYSNPQMESDYVAVGSRKTMSMLGGVGSSSSSLGGSGAMAIRPQAGATHASSRFAQPNENYFASPGSTPSSRQPNESYFAAPSPVRESPIQAQSASPRAAASPHDFSPMNRGRVDPSPLLARSPSEREDALAPSMSAALAPQSDPHKPLRRWLFDFPPRVDDFFRHMDSAVTRFIQRPLATVGGLTNSLEEEILQSSEMASQARREEEETRQSSRRGGDQPNPGLQRSQSMSHLVLRKSMAITRRNKVLVALALLYTGLTTIELGVFGAIFLFLSGYDEIGTLQLLITSYAALSSQLFKRFCWRARPWMQNRSIVVKRDKTSSFPSRAVLCASVYAYSFCHLFYKPHELPLWFWPPFVLAFAFGAGVSRIFVGAHFASDCLAGFLLGAVGCAIGSLANQVFEDVCGSCYFHACYAQSLDRSVDFTDFPQLNLGLLAGISVISVVCVGLAMSSPIHFWTKVNGEADAWTIGARVYNRVCIVLTPVHLVGCSLSSLSPLVQCIHIFGSLFPCFAFRLVLLCPSHAGGFALRRVSKPEPAFIFVCLLLAAGLLVFTKLLSKLTVVETTVQLSTESGSGGSGEESLFTGLEASLLSTADENSVSRTEDDNPETDPGYDPPETTETTDTVETDHSERPAVRGCNSSMSRTGGLGHTEESTRRFLHRSSVAGMAWNLLIYSLAFSVVFVTLMLWRVYYVKTTPEE